MKKLFTLLCAVALTASVSAQKITSVTVTTKSELTTAINDAATLSPGDFAYIYIQGDINLGSFTFPGTTRNIHFVGIDGEEGQSTLRAEFEFPTNESENDGFGATFENLHLMDNNGEWGNSKHFMNFKDANKHFVDTLRFTNCEISNICRSFVRCQINDAPTDGSYTGAGTFKHFEMTNCVFHNASRQSNAMPLIYMAQPTNTMVFRNNTFYDLTYLNALVTYNYMTDETGRQALKFTFENNTLVAYAKSTLFNFGSYVNNESEFHIKNNFFLFPNWIDECNNRVGDTNSSHDMTEEATTRDGETTTFGYMTEDEVQARVEKGTVLTNIEGGLVQLEKNVLLGYKHQNMADAIEAGDIINIGDTEEEEDEISFYTMEDVNFAWTDFTDPKMDMFQINIAHPVYTAGVKGAPIGDERNYTDKVIKVVYLNAHVEGSKSASITVSPQKDAYMSGDVVTLTANVNGSLNTFKGWSNGMTEPVIEVTLDDDLDIAANFEELNYVAVWNLDDLTTNNVKKLSPVTPNYGDESLALNYMRYLPDGYVVWNADNSAFVNDIEDADEKKAAGNVFMTRNNKVAGDIRNCYLITTSAAEFALGADGHADYLFIEAAETLQPTKIQFFAATDNVPYKQYAISTSADGEAWTVASTFEMSNNGQWNLVEAELPAAKFIRIKGVESEGMFISADFQELIDAGTNSVASEYLFVAELILMPSDGQGIVSVSNNGAEQQSPVYNLMGIRVNGQAKGLLIQNGKKHIVK